MTAGCFGGIGAVEWGHATLVETTPSTTALLIHLLTLRESVVKINAEMPAITLFFDGQL